jgi:hemolysin activation/secretion protein
MGGGNTLSMYAVHSDSDVAVVGGINTIGRGDIVGLRYLLTLPGTAAFYQTVNLGADFKDFKQSVSQIGSSGFNTPIRYLPGALGWDGGWTEPGHDARLGVAFNFQWPGLVGNEQEFADKRFKGHPGYGYLKGSFSRKDTVRADWALEARGTWQYATQALISNEQYSIGGEDSVRGYYESAATGENGLALTLEVSTPNLISEKDWSIRDLRLIAFVDSAQVSVIDSLFAANSFSLSGNGLGLRMSGPHGFNLALDLATAMNGSGSVKAGDSRLHFRMAYDW